METLNEIMSNYALLSAVVIFIITLIAIIGLKIVSRKTGVPTQEIEGIMQAINDQAKVDIIEETAKIYRDPKTGKFVSSKQKVLPANTNEPQAKKAEEESEAKEESEPSKSKGLYIPIVLLLLLPLVSCSSIFETGYKLFNDNVEVTWKNDGTKQLQPIDSIVVKSQPVYWKETENGYMVDSVEYETEFVKDGYKVWQLRTQNWKRFEVQRLDTIIYIYKK